MDIYIVLTGRRRSGKDSLADIAIKDFGCAGKVALADWFKRVLSNEFKFHLHKFYSEEKDYALVPPIVLDRGHLRNLMMQLGAAGFNNVNRISTSKWEGRQINSLRELMLWFGHDVVTKNCGDEFHCKVTEKALAAVPRKPNHANIIFVTDARQYIQSKYFLDKYPFVFPVRVTRPDSSNDEHAVEKSVDEFPADYFFAEINNNKTLAGLKTAAKNLLLEVKGAVCKRTGGPLNQCVEKAAPKAEEKQEPTNSPEGTKRGE